MKVEIVQTENIGELDNLINACIKDRKVQDIKLSTAVIPENTIKYTALIILSE